MVADRTVFVYFSAMTSADQIYTVLSSIDLDCAGAVQPTQTLEACSAERLIRSRLGLSERLEAPYAVAQPSKLHLTGRCVNTVPL